MWNLFDSFTKPFNLLTYNWLKIFSNKGQKQGLFIKDQDKDLHDKDQDFTVKDKDQDKDSASEVTTVWRYRNLIIIIIIINRS